MNTLLLLLAIFIAYKVSSRVYYEYLRYKWHCGRPFQLDSQYLYKLFGLLKLRAQAESIKSGYSADHAKKEYDDNNMDTFETMSMGRTLIGTMNSENIKAVVANQFNNFGIGSRKLILGEFLGDGIFVVEGHDWKVSRERLRPSFSREQVSQIEAIEPHFQNFKTKLLQNCDNDPNGFFDLQALFFNLSFDVSSEFLFSESVGTLKPNDSEISRNYHAEGGFTDSLKVLQKYIKYKGLAGKYARFISTAEYRKASQTIRDFAGVYVDRVLALSPQELNEKSSHKFIFLYELAKITRDPKVLTDEVLNIMFAGRDTTSALLSFMFFELTRNPDIYQKLRQEILSTFGTGEDLSSITFESIKKCKYLRYCLNEALRMYPPVLVNFRVCYNTTTLPRGGGPSGQEPILVPKGTSVVFHTYALQRSKVHYGDDADTFRPERWENLKPGWAYMPFLSGPRVCLGQQFALTEASYVTIRLLQTFKSMDTNMTTYPPRKMPSPASKLADGLYVNLVPEKQEL